MTNFTRAAVNLSSRACCDDDGCNVMLSVCMSNFCWVEKGDLGESAKERSSEEERRRGDSVLREKEGLSIEARTEVEEGCHAVTRVG